MQCEKECDVRQRPRGHERDLPVTSADLLREEVGCVLCNRFPLRRRQLGAVESRLSVHVRGDERIAHEGPVGAGGDGDVVASDEVEHADGVRGRLLQRLVPRDGRDAEQLELRGRECE